MAKYLDLNFKEDMCKGCIHSAKNKPSVYNSNCFECKRMRKDLYKIEEETKITYDNMEQFYIC